MERSLPSLGGRLTGLIRRRLWLQVLIGMIAGVAIGVALGPTAGLVSPYMAAVIGNWVALPGRLFLLAIQFVVVPLVVASVIRGIAGGDAGGAALKTTVIPFIIRGVTLAGVDSVMAPAAERAEVWGRLARDLPTDKLDAATSVVGLEDAIGLADDILAGKVRGRTVVDVNA